MTRMLLMTTLVAALILDSSVVLAETRPESRPNFVVILCDDLGFGDLSVHGHPVIRTSNIDQLANTGIRFSNFYSAAPVCSPSRVGLMTGRSPNRAGVFDWIPEAKGPKTDARDLVHMRRSELTLPQLLKEAGYATFMAGKWHCNSQFNSPEQPQPNDAGFEHWLATQNNAGPSHENPVNYVRNGNRLGELKGFSCQIVVDEATQWLDQRQSSSPDQPFFLYLALHEPHEPVASPPDLVQHYLPHSMNEDQAQYFANVHHVDLAVGRLLSALDSRKLRDNTVIVFSSDNGPETLRRYRNGHRSWGRTGVLRGMKLHTHDGGFHVAGILNWPARVSVGQVIDAPVSSLDLLPTFCDLAGVDIPNDRPLDGISLAPLLKDGRMPERTQPLLWAYYNAVNEQRVAMRHGPWKVLARLDAGRLPRMENLTPAMLKEVQHAELTDITIYDVSQDPGETQNLAGRGLPNETELITLMQVQYQALAADSYAWPIDDSR